MNSTPNDASINNSWDILQITVEEALPIRHQVLWPNKTMDECRVEDDENGEHFGVFVEGELVCVASIFIKGKEARLRKFATLEQYQRQGIGHSLLNHIMVFLEQHAVDLFWCDARENAMSLYKKFAMEPQGGRFFKGDIPYRKMSVTL